jgi:small subunit ribosomal protein S24e
MPMDFKITSDRRNELLKRREITFTLGYDKATPSRSEVMGKVCAILNLNEKTVVLDQVKSRFGTRVVTGSARIYDDEESRVKTERGYLAERGKPKAAPEGGT